MAVPPEFIEDLRQRVPLSDVVGRRVKLVRKGRRHTGLCPFHAEKTPSFSVVDDDGSITVLAAVFTATLFLFCVKLKGLNLWKRLSG